MGKFVNNDDVKSVAKLIRINLDDTDSYVDQLNMVLEAVEVLKELDTDKVRETSQTHGLENILAEDIPEESLNMDEYPNRKNVENNYFVVKKVL